MDPKKKIVPIKGVEMSLVEKPADKTKKPTTRFIIQYTLGLLAAAFLLVLLSYSHQQRMAEEQAQFSVSAMQSVQSLLEDNERYAKELDDAQKEIESLTNALTDARTSGNELWAQRDEARKALSETEAELYELSLLAEGRRRAMEYLWRVEVLLSSRKTSAARALLTEMRDQGISEFLPDDKMEGMETLDKTPAEEYRSLVERLLD